MSDSIITVEGLGKRYRLGAQSGFLPGGPTARLPARRKLQLGERGERYTALRDVIAQKAAAPFRFLHVVRYDTAHGVPHRDLLDKRGRVLRKNWLVGMTFEQALIHAKEDLLKNYERYIKNFETT